MNFVKKGLFISIEGPDGSGKTTQINLLRDFLIDNNVYDFEIIFTREPGGTTIGEKIRDIILDNSHTEMDDLTEAMLYAAARAQHVEEVIKPALREGKLVICDRFVDSSIAYQEYGRNLGENVSTINKIAVNHTMPYRTIFIDLDPELARNRIEESVSHNTVLCSNSNVTNSGTLSEQFNNEGGRTHLDRLELEKLSFHQKVYDGYKKIISKNRERFVVVDGRGSIDEIQLRIRNTLLQICKEFLEEE